MTAPFEAVPTKKRLPIETVHRFLAPYLAAGDQYLDLARTFGSPLYVLDRDVLSQRADRFIKAFAGRLPSTGFYYAVKSNSLPALSAHLLTCGFGLDVSSGQELAMALSLGAGDIIFSGPGKTDAELAQAVNHADRVTILLDSSGEYRRLARITEQRQTPVSVGIRLNSNPNGLWRKFGILPDRLAELYRAIDAHPYIRFKGLQFHSSWNMTPDRQAAFVKELGTILESMPKGLIDQLSFIDIGGGYWPPQGEWLLSDSPQEYILDPAVDIDVFAQALVHAIEAHIFSLAPCRICFEPGRWICNDAMHILIRVLDKKGPDLVITDAGTNTVGWERYETDYCPIINLSRKDHRERPCHVLGALCTPHDVWGYAYFGADIQEGDVLMIPAQGAYTYSLRQHFIKPVPRVVVMDQHTPPFRIDPADIHQ